MATYKYDFEKDDSTLDSLDDNSSSLSSQTMSDLSQASITSGPHRPSSTASSSTDQKQCGGRRRGKRGGKKHKDVKNRTIVFVGNLPSACKPHQLLEHFSLYKSYIRNKPIILGPKKGTTRFSFLHFDAIDTANEVIQAMNNTKIQGNKIYVNLKDKKGSSSTDHEAVAKHNTESYEARYIPEEWVGMSEDDDDSVFSSYTEDTHKDGTADKGKGRNKRQQFTVGVRNLPPGCTSEELLDHLSVYKSDICNKSFKINKSKKSSSYFFAFLKFQSLEKATEVVDRMNNSTFKEKKIRLKLQEKTGGSSEPKKEHHMERAAKPSTSKKLVHNKSLSIELYGILCKSEEARISEFKRRDGTIEYYQPTSTMIVCGPSVEVMALMKQFERYIERELCLSPHQWNSLVQVDQQGKRQMDEISAPFLANPVVKITEPQPLKILIVGVKEAVDGAHEHFIKCMNKEIKVDSSKITALVQLVPDLPQQIRCKYGVTIKGYAIGSTAIELQDVSNHEIVSMVHELLEEKLSSLCYTSVPAVVPPSLMGAAKDTCCKDGFPVIVKEEQGRITLWSTSLDSLEKAKNVFTKKPYFNKIELSRFKETCLYFSFSEKFTFDGVNIRREDKTVVMEGYNKQEVQSAKKVVVKFLNETFAKQKVETIVEECLKCSEPQLMYLTRSLQSTEEPDEIMKSLPGKVCLKDGKVFIKGTKEEVSETADGLLDSVPKHSKRTFEKPRNPYFLPSLLKSYVLASIDHIIVKNDGKEAGGRVMVYLYENNANALSDVEEKLDAINPRVLIFTVSPKAKNILKKMVGDLERQERCRIDLMKLDTPRIAVHGLTQQERDRAKAAIKNYISENYTVFREIPSPRVTGLQMKYVLSKHGEELKELGKGLKQCNIPFEVTRKSPFDISLDPNVFIKVSGTSKAINAFEDSVLPEFSGDFDFEKFKLRIRNVHRFPWNRRWSTLKQEAEATQAIVMEYRLPRREDRDGPVQFIIYGNQSRDVRQLRETIESEVAAGTAEAKIKLKTELVGQVLTALKDKQLNFDDYLIKVTCIEKDEIIYLNSLAIADDCLELVKAEINGFLECTDTSYKETIEFDDSLLLALFLSKNFPFFSDASTIAKKFDVHVLTLEKQSGVDHATGKIPGICLSGSKAAVNAVKMQVDVLISTKIKGIIDTRRMTVDSLLQCALTPAVKSRLEKKLQEEYCVHITGYQPAKNRPVIRQKTLRTVSIKLSRESSVVKLSLVKASSVEDLSSQSTDVVVIPTSMDLQHVSPVAMDVFNKGGLLLKKECDNYIRRNGMLVLGDVVITGSGWLNCQSVVHAAVPVWNRGRSGEREKFYTAIFNSLSESAGYSSICFPDLGCDGHFEIPTVECADLSLRAVRDFFYHHSSSSLKELTFILFKDDAPRLFIDAISTVFQVDSIISDDVDTTYRTSSLSSLATLSSGLQWQWKNDQGGYSNYSPQDCTRINDAYERNPSGRFILTIGIASYTIDFNRMVQINNKTNFERKITFVDNSTAPTATASWHWTNDSGKLTPYNPTESDKLEAMYRLKSPRMIVINGKFYRFDFERMVQINATSGGVRKIHRKAQTKQTLPTAEASGFPVKSSQTNSMIITLRGPKSNLQASENDVRRYLKQSIREERIQLTSKVDQSFAAKINEITTKHSVLYELEDGAQGKKVLIIKGVNVDKAVNKLQRYIIEQQATSEDINIPQEWQQTQSGTTEVFQLARGTAEWIKVEKIFCATMPDYPIKEILRIQNLYLWEKWVEERKRIEKFKGCVNEKELFHGTGKNDPKIIYDSEIGFDMRFCSTGMWGQANYFAVNARYSHSYAHTNALGQHEMFLVRLITGDSYTSEPNKKLRMPPLKDDDKMGLSQVRYDTVNGNTYGSRVFMSYDNQKAYPAYLIRYCAETRNSYV